MSKLTLVNGTDGVLVGGATTSLLSIAITATEPPVGSTIDLHDCEAVGDLAAGNKVASYFVGATPAGASSISQVFDGALFKKGLVVKCSAAVPVVLETA